MPDQSKDKFLNLTGLGYLIGKLDEKYKSSNYYAFSTLIYPDNGNFSATQTDTTISLLQTSPITITRTANTHQLTFGHADSGVTIPTGQSTASFPGTASNNPISIDFNDTFTVPTFTVNSMGHITVAGTTTYQLPDNPGHYSAYLVTGASSSAKANAAVSSGNVYLNLVENNIIQNSHKLIGTNIAITCEDNGDITFAGTEDKNVQSTAAATTKLYLVGTSSSGTATGTLSKDTNVYLTTTSGELYAQKFETTNLKLPGITSGTTVTVTAIAKSTDSTTNNDTSLVTTGYVKELIGGVTQISYEVLEANDDLPTTGTTGVIYLKPTSTGDNAYEEYLWINGNPGRYEQIGRTDVDLSGYWTEAELTAITTTEIAALFPSAS